MPFRLLLPFLVFTTIGFSQNIPLPAEVEKSIISRIEYGTNPSIVVGIIDQNGTRYYSFGSKRIGGEPVDEHTIYEIGSISKTFTATMLADNIVKGKMKADDPASKYLPSTVQVPSYEGQPITLGNLSDHTSSLPRMPDNFTPADPSNPYADYTLEQLYSFLSSWQLTRPVGSEYEYSNLAVGLLGNILASYAGTSYENLLKIEITSPLKMNETGITLTRKMKANLATGYNMDMEIPNWDLPAMAGAGAIRSSAHDMLLYLSANMGLTPGPLQDAMNLAHTPRHNLAGDYSVGLGWHIGHGNFGDFIFHNGATGGYMAFAGYSPSLGIGVAVLTNCNESVDDIGFHMLNPDSPLKEVKPSFAKILAETIEKNGPESAIEQYNTLKQHGLEKYEVDENAINALGYYYLGVKKPDAARALFQINVSAFPASFNVYDSYGEALMIIGRKEEAIVNYKKSLELNPGNTNAVDMLAQMGEVVKPMDVAVDETTLQNYVGIYELAPGFNIEISRKAQQLFGQATGQGQFELFPISQTEFYLKVVEARIVFNTSPEGIVGMTLYQNGQAMPGRRME